MTPYDITDEFERQLADYTGAKYAVAVDSQSNALFLCLKRCANRVLWEFNPDENDVPARAVRVGVQKVMIPSHTYPSVPCAVIHAGYKVEFEPNKASLKGAYRLKPTPIWDSALRFTADCPPSGRCPTERPRT